MPSLVVIGKQIKEKWTVPPPAYMVPKDPSLNRVKCLPHHRSITHDAVEIIDAIFQLMDF